MMKKKMCAGLALMLIITAISGCQRPSIVQKEEISNDNKYEIIWYERGPSSADLELVNAEINKYIADKIGATVKYNPIVGSEYNEKLQLALATGEKIDMCFTNASNFYGNVISGAYIEIDDLLDQYGKEAKALVPEYVLNGSRVNGKLYGYPAYKDYANETVFYYRKDLADKYGFDMDSIKSFKDLEPVLQKIKEEEPDIYPMTFLPTFSPFNLQLFDTIAGGIIGAVRYDKDDGRIINPFEEPEVLEQLRVVHDFYQKGLLRPDIATTTTNADIQYTVFMNIYSELPYLVDQWNETCPNEMAVWHGSQPVMNTSGIQGAIMAITRTSKNPEKTMQFINLLNTDEYLRNLVAYGIEGKHYIADGKNHYKIPEGFQTLADTGYRTYVYTQGNKYLTRMISGTPDDIYEKYKNFDNTALKSPALGFMFDASNVTTEMTAVQNAYNEYMPAILSGAADPDEFLPKAMEKFKQAGLDRILVEMQKQYDAWRAAKQGSGGK